MNVEDAGAWHSVLVPLHVCSLALCLGLLLIIFYLLRLLCLLCLLCLAYLFYLPCLLYISYLPYLLYLSLLNLSALYIPISKGESLFFPNYSPPLRSVEKRICCLC